MSDDLEKMRAELESLRSELEKALGFIEHGGYRRCDIPACNCNSWHGGKAEERLFEVKESLEQSVDLNGKTILQGVDQLRAELAEARRDLKRAEATIDAMKRFANFNSTTWGFIHNQVNAAMSAQTKEGV